MDISEVLTRTDYFMLGSNLIVKIRRPKTLVLFSLLSPIFVSLSPPPPSEIPQRLGEASKCHITVNKMC